MRTRPLSLFLAAATLACSGDAPPAGQSGMDESPAPSAEARITVDPLPAGTLPAVLTGEAPAPMGSDLAYFEGSDATVGYLAVPEGEGPFPAVILIHEWNGVVDRIRQTADALAREGYVALAADLYQGRTGSNAEENMALVRETQADPDAIIANLNAAAAYLRARPDVTGKIGTMGWCFGGGVALSYAIGGENHDATAIFYGRLVDDPALLSGLTHEVYGTFGALDQGPSPESVAGFADALAQAGIENDLHIYDDVNHGFWLYVERDPENATAPALDAWERLRGYLKRTLGD